MATFEYFPCYRFFSPTSESEIIIFYPWGGGVFSIFVRRECAILRASFSPIFARTVYQKRAIFLEPVVKACQKGKCF